MRISETMSSLCFGSRTTPKGFFILLTLPIGISYLGGTSPLSSYDQTPTNASGLTAPFTARATYRNNVGEERVEEVVLPFRYAEHALAKGAPRDLSVRQELERHLEHCEDCKMVVDQTRLTVDIFCDSKPIELTSDVKSRLHDALRRKLQETGN